MPEKAIVIGAGLGGLAVASLLAADGYHVEVFEKNHSPGGKLQQVEANGYRFDTGPSLFTMPFILEKLFDECGEDLRQYLSWTELSPLCRYFYNDGVQFDNYKDRKKSAAGIDRIAPEDSGAYDSFLNKAEDLYNFTAKAFLFNPLYSLSDLKNLKLTNFLKIDAFSTVSQKVDKSFQSRYLRQFFKRFTTYNGSSPFQAPATLNVIPHVELNQGGYYVLGGMYQIVLAIKKLADQLGVIFHFNTPVQSISVANCSVSSVEIERGRIEKCNLLFANSDATDTLLNLLPEKSLSAWKRKKYNSIEPSSSGFVMLLGCRKQWPCLQHHTIFFSSDYRKEFYDIFEKKIMPEDPTLYVANTSLTDPTHAPPNSSNLFVLVNAPYVNRTQNWDETERSYSSFLVDELEKRGLDQLRKSIEYREIITPIDFLRRYGSNRGSIYGTSSNSKLAAFLRPRNKLRGFDNLYLVGGSTHPGGGIPLVIQSAFNAMELMRRED